MSGIFAYTGKDNARDIILSGISKLKNRGQDMAGFVLREENAFASFKIKGTPDELSHTHSQTENISTTGIAECAREEICKASSLSAPPASNESFAVALDGDIQNFLSLKKWSSRQSAIVSREDLVLACLCIMNEENKIALANKVYTAIIGSPSFAFMPAEENAIYCKSGSSKLIIGYSKSGSFLASELDALLPFCEKYAVLEENESAKLLQDRIIVFDSKMKRIKKTFQNIKSQNLITNDFVQGDELYSAPLAIRETNSRFIKNGQIYFNSIKLSNRYFDRVNRIILVSNGSSKNTALAAKSLFETYCSVYTDALDSSEFLTSKVPLDKNALIIAISPDGENKSTVLAVKKARANHAKTIALSGNTNSALARECDYCINTSSKNGESPLSFRAFISDYLTLCLFSLYIGSKINIVSDLYLGVTLKMAELLTGILSAVIKSSLKLEKTAKLLLSSDEIYITCAGEDNLLCHEAERIIRETLIKNAKAVLPGDLSDYPEQLINSKTVIVLITDKNSFQREMKNILRMKNRGANIIIIASEGIEEEVEGFENIITFTDSLPALNPITCIASVYKIALLADKTAKEKDMEQSA